MCDRCQATPCDCNEKIWATRYRLKDGTSYLNNYSGGEVCLYTRPKALEIAENLDPWFMDRVEKITVERGWKGMREACATERVILDLLGLVPPESKAARNARKLLKENGWGEGLWRPPT